MSIRAKDYSALKPYLEAVGQLILEETLKRLPDEDSASYLEALVREYPLRGGKKFWPALMLLCCELMGGRPEDAVISAVALELFHNFALIHDDIEDASEMRRGLKTLHRIYGVPLAINAGDALCGLAHVTLLENGLRLGLKKSMEIHEYFNLVMQKTFEGQAMDIGWVHEGIFPDRNQYWEMAGKKTGWYSGRGPCCCGGMIAEADTEMLNTLGRFGSALGLGFQVRDDVLNLSEISDSENSSTKEGGYGKERGGDFAEGKRTLVTIEMLERLNNEDSSTLREVLLKDREEVSKEEIKWCLKNAHQTGAVEAVRCEAELQYFQALEELDSLPNGSTLEKLKNLADVLAARRKV